MTWEKYVKRVQDEKRLKALADKYAEGYKPVHDVMPAPAGNNKEQKLMQKVKYD